MKKIIAFLFLALFSAASAFAGSIRLKNNSDQRLRVIVDSASGMSLGEVIIDSGQSLTWTDTYGNRTNNRGARTPLQYGDASNTPYTVSWYCMSGEPYSVCTDVAVGSLIMSDSCDGLKACKRKKAGYPDHFKEEEEETSP